MEKHRSELRNCIYVDKKYLYVCEYTVYSGECSDNLGADYIVCSHSCRNVVSLQV